MTSRERMAEAMAKGEPDRPPFMCQLSLGHYFLNTELDEIEIWHDSDTFAEALVTLQRRYGFDGILVNLPGRDSAWRDQVEKIESGPGTGRTIRWKDGTSTVVPPDDNPHVVSAAGEARIVPVELVDPEELFYVEPHDLSGVTYPYSWGIAGGRAEPGGPGFFPPWHLNTLRRVRSLAGPDVSVHAEIFSPFTQLMELLGYTEGLVSLLLDQGKCLAILERLAEEAACLGGMYAGEDIDAVLISSAFVGAGFIPIDHYRTFEMPFVKRIVQGIRAASPDLPVYLHTCGSIGDRDGIDTLDPPPLGTVELAEALRILGKLLFIKGNVDPVHTVLNGTPELVREAARERLRLAAPGGAYILSTACSVPPEAPRENILAMGEALSDFTRTRM